MANIWEQGSGLFRDEYPFSRVLLTVGLDGVERTKGVEDELGCCRKTALNKLHELADLGSLNRDEFGNSLRWTLNTKPIEPPATSSGVDDQTITEFVSETLRGVALRLDTDITPDVEEWALERVDDEDTDIRSYLMRVAVFNRFLKATLYSFHRRENEHLPKLTVEDDWAACFGEANQLTKDRGFQSSSVDEAAEDCPEAVDRTLLALRNAFVRAENPAGLLSETYESLVSQSARRDLGQFATPPHVGEFMASWVVQQPDDRVLDPGIGAGQLSYQVLSRKMSKNAEDPLADLTGIDIDEISISMASTALKLADGDSSPDLHQGDFIRFSPLYSGGGRLQKYDGVIGNPPYSRHQALDNQMKVDLNLVVSKETGYEFLQKTPLYGYFLVHSAQFLEPGGRAAFIVPSKFMETKFGRNLKDYLLQEFEIHSIVQLDDSVEIFEGVRTRPSILLLEEGSPASDHETQFVRLNEWPSTGSAEEYLSGPETLVDEPEVEFATRVAQDILTPTEKWTDYFSETDLRELIEEVPELVAFSDISTIKRGIATGKNDFFCLSSDDVEAHQIPIDYRKKIMRTARGLEILDIRNSDWKQWRDDGDDVWLLYCFEDGEILDKSEIDSEAVLEYLQKGENKGVTDGTLVSRRNPWYRVDARDPAPVLGKYMNRDGFQFYRNDIDLLTLNNVHPIYHDLEDDIHENALLAYLNSTTVERIFSKSSHDYSGLKKLEIGRLESAPVVDPRRLEPETRGRLSELFQSLCKARRSKNENESNEIVAEIDRLVEPILNIGAK